MESFSLAAQHSGAIKHLHAIHVDASAVAVARELRLAVTVVVVGWVAVTGLRAVLGARYGRAAGSA
ncbi:Uu.00g040530.m01.CDS01 [Anthostomella pinea]|uniref:Uu.00g040530.m01.CDS01 n=1 Tax=Anthostomella pinea TaxID=933095 RepID=A0AAI8VA82_9PEZI|nr:Uu.00g040530.m01.CDS01 [Anthostomella pinea]